ncbi:hypothetical protein N7495_009397 [Penicillium taxi]|uniref:uncharacterized protein n=1 Tax=Penicillium taxi TaxID=168475 RepID=UPI00254543E0|nr:uncharacterized protein N7495_009397 [Penicillium taxi]KAJ5884887.1 hypothetical protein N7495_009397 [Penicillium taxi]
MSVRPPTFRVFWSYCNSPSLRSGLQIQSPSSWRSFSSSIARATKNPQSKPASPAHLRPKPGAIGAVGRLALKVARQGEILLFKGPSHRAYIISAYGISGFCFAYAVYNSNEVFNDPIAPRPIWQKTLFGGICVVMSLMGTLFLSRTTNLIRSMSAVKSQGQLNIRFKVRRAIPFMKPLQFDVPPTSITFTRRLAVSKEGAKKFDLEARRTGSTEKTATSFLKAPVKALSYGLWRSFLSSRQLFTGEDFILLHIAGHKNSFRMDANGFVSDDFWALGSPVQFKRKV